ncbi:hypothetical protein VTO73DRAFT_216 [Trametes versicolor]
MFAEVIRKPRGPAHLDSRSPRTRRLGERPPPSSARHRPSAKLAEHRVPDYYALLSVSPSASPTHIKAAYHRALLASHPDKRDFATADSADIGLLQQAFHTLYTPDLRKEYDVLRASSRKPTGPRPAQVISLEEFEERGDAEDSLWVYPCRIWWGARAAQRSSGWATSWLRRRPSEGPRCDAHEYAVIFLDLVRVIYVSIASPNHINCQALAGIVRSHVG